MENLKKPYYGYRILPFITFALIGGGAVATLLAVIFTIAAHSTWVLVLCWALGVILIISGILWYLSVGWINNPEVVGRLQDNSMALLGDLCDGKGKVLDIGTGLGRVTIEIARRFPEASVVGVDTWTKLWCLFGMGKAGAEKNATIEKVTGLCTFQKGNALNLPFKDAEFQLVVSSFAFHEVKTPDRMRLFREVLRVITPGGCFAICDLFGPHYLRRYGVETVPELLEKVTQLGACDIKFKTLEEAGFSPGVLAHIWGYGYLSGKKNKIKDKKGGEEGEETLSARSVACAILKSALGGKGGKHDEKTQSACLCNAGDVDERCVCRHCLCRCKSMR